MQLICLDGRSYLATKIMSRAAAPSADLREVRSAALVKNKKGAARTLGATQCQRSPGCITQELVMVRRREQTMLARSVRTIPIVTRSAMLITKTNRTRATCTTSQRCPAATGTTAPWARRATLTTRGIAGTGPVSHRQPRHHRHPRHLPCRHRHHRHHRRRRSRLRRPRRRRLPLSRPQPSTSAPPR